MQSYVMTRSRAIAAGVIRLLVRLSLLAITPAYAMINTILNNMYYVTTNHVAGTAIDVPKLKWRIGHFMLRVYFMLLLYR